MIKLRPENFGGLAFNTETGTKLFLDQEGFNTLSDFIQGKAAKVDKTTKEFLADACQKLNVGKRQFYFAYPNPQPKTKYYPFTVLNAPTLVDFQITQTCNLSCPHCYAESIKRNGHVPLKDIIMVFDKCKEAGVFEVALGGGEPTLHPDFLKILKAAKQRDLVCNLATNGKSLDIKKAKILKKYCWAVALSLEFVGLDFEKRRGFKFERFLESAKLLNKVGSKLVFQITVSQSNLDKIYEMVKLISHLKPYGVVFLTYKPVGRGQHFDAPLSVIDHNQVLKNLQSCFKFLNDQKIKIGYDCCMGNLLTSLGTTVYGCSATRESIAINTNLDVLPCSFTKDIKLGNLHKENLSSIWHNYQANLFRLKLKDKITNDKNCQWCQYNTTCLGGCPVFDLVRCKYIG